MSPFNPGQYASQLQVRYTNVALIAASAKQICPANSGRITLMFSWIG